MNCYGTNPNINPNTSVSGGAMPSNYPQAQTYYDQPYPEAAGQTTTSGEWSEPVPVDPNLPTSPVSVTRGIPAEELPDTLTLPIYTPGYLRQHIGDLMRVEFLVGSSTTDRVGRLKQVGASFIVLASLDGASDMVCDIYSIKFVTIIHNPADRLLISSFTGN